MPLGKLSNCNNSDGRGNGVSNTSAIHIDGPHAAMSHSTTHFRPAHQSDPDLVGRGPRIQAKSTTCHGNMDYRAPVPSANTKEAENIMESTTGMKQLGDEQLSVPASSNTLASSTVSTPTMILSKASLATSDGVLDASSPTTMPGNRLTAKKQSSLSRVAMGSQSQSRASLDTVGSSSASELSAETARLEQLRKTHIRTCGSIAFLVGMVTMTNVIATLFALVVYSPGSSLYSRFQGDVLSSIFDWGTWILGAFMARAHYAMVYSAVVADKKLNVVLAMFILLIGTIHLVNCLNPFHESVGAHFRTLGELGRHISYVALLILLPLALRLRIAHVKKHEAARARVLPHQEPSNAFPLTLTAISIFFGSYLAKNSSQSILFIGSAATLGMTSWLVVVRNAHKGSKFAKHFDANYLLHTGYHLVRALHKALFTVIASPFGEANPNMVIFGFRVLFGAFVLLMDNVVPAAVGHPILWVVFYARVAETLSSTLASLNSTRTYGNLTTFLIANLLLVVAKDGGIIDDTFFYLKYRFCVFRPGELGMDKTNGGKKNSHTSASGTGSASGASPAPIQSMSNLPTSPAGSTVLDSPPQPRPRLLTADAALKQDLRSSKPHLSRTGSSRGLQLANGRLPSPNGSMSSFRFGADLSKTAASTAKSPEITLLEVKGDKIQQMQFELRLQIVRSEQMFTARLAALVGIAVPYVLVTWLQVTHPDKVKLPTDPVSKQVALLVLVGIAVELAIGRAIASWLLEWKIKMLAQHEAVSRSTAGRLASGKSAAAPRAAGTVPKLCLWTTALPKKQEYVLLVSLSTVFVCLIILGPWTT